jgi:hypothetical protein
MASIKIVMNETIQYLASTSVDKLNELMVGDWEKIETEDGKVYYKQVIDDEIEVTYETNRT